jgi:hypothetical protein
MSWQNISNAIQTINMPDGYRFELLQTGEIEAIVSKLSKWFPEIAIGVASPYLRPTFYADKVYFDNGISSNNDIVVFAVKYDQELVGMVSCERELEGKVLYVRVAALSAEHRGSGVASTIIRLQEAVALATGMEMTYVLASLSIRQVQTAYEKMGWSLIGIAPGYDREVTKKGEVKRVYEAIYAKVLVADTEFTLPSVESLTPKTQALFDVLFPGKLAKSSDNDAEVA